MDTFKSFEHLLYSVNDQNFEDIALRVFRFQVQNNTVYGDFATRLGRTGASSLAEIPFLPISFFKTHDVRTGEWVAKDTFTSSGTTGQNSRHPVMDVGFYLSHSERIFNEFFGPLRDYHVLALLPSYLERDGSSLVVMADYFIRKSGSPHSGFYLDDQKGLVQKLEELRATKSPTRRVLLLGVTFALLDLAEKFPMDLRHCLVMETGGMKGRRQEITREEVHSILCSKFNVSEVLSEYGMTELFSQAYSLGEGYFRSPAQMKVVIRDISDPFAGVGKERTGGINVVDLANLHSCAFIETQDLGKIGHNDLFQVLGRMDNSDVRGCNLMVE